MFKLLVSAWKSVTQYQEPVSVEIIDPQGYYMYHHIGPEEGFTTRAKAQTFVRDYKREEARNA